MYSGFQQSMIDNSGASEWGLTSHPTRHSGTIFTG